MRWVGRALLIIASGSAVADQRVPSRCHDALDRALPGWSIPRPSDDEVEWSNGENLDPAVAHGDFNGDRRRDVAVLVEQKGVRKVALCLSDGPRAYRTMVIDDPYCTDVIFTTPAGTKVYNFERDAGERIRHDGLSTYCLGKAGALYVVESGHLRRIVDSD